MRQLCHHLCLLCPLAGGARRRLGRPLRDGPVRPSRAPPGSGRPQEAQTGPTAEIHCAARAAKRVQRSRNAFSSITMTKPGEGRGPPLYSRSPHRLVVRVVRSFYLQKVHSRTAARWVHELLLATLESQLRNHMRARPHDVAVPASIGRSEYSSSPGGVGAPNRRLRRSPTTVRHHTDTMTRHGRAERPVRSVSDSRTWARPTS